MHLSILHISLALLAVTQVLADLLGPSYPAPVDLTSNKSFVAAGWKNLTSTLQTYLSNDNLSSAPANLARIQKITFSIGMFSLNDAAASELQFHYTSPEIANAPNGTHKVDGNSIYRLASITKVFTVFAGLLNLTPTDWDLPFTKIFASLANYTQESPGKDDAVHTIPWDQVTPSALAAQISGITRDVLPFSAAELYSILPDPSIYGLPPINISDPQELTPCALALLNGSICSAELYLEGAKIQAPSFRPWSTPAYANNGFILLGLAISKLTGKSMDLLFRESIFDPLDMTSSNSSAPPQSEWYRAVIPGNPVVSFAFDAGVAVSTGALLSTTHDLAKFGIGILNSTLLPPDQTRKWLKPVSHTARLQYSVGRPWEIIRYSHPSGHVTDIYTKLGDSGAYSSWMILLPDYNAGFSILSAGSETTRFEIVASIAQLVTDSLLPALEAQSAIEAESRFVGTYMSTIPGLNSSLVLVNNPTLKTPPGLVISSWISNGTDIMTTTLARGIGPTPWRLSPSILDPENGKAAFFLVSAADAVSPQAPTQLFSGPSLVLSDWTNIGALTYGKLPLSSFVFDVGTDGKATAVRPSAFRATLNRAA